MDKQNENIDYNLLYEQLVMIQNYIKLMIKDEDFCRLFEPKNCWSTTCTILHVSGFYNKWTLEFNYNCK